MIPVFALLSAVQRENGPRSVRQHTPGTGLGEVDEMIPNCP